jgi:hypothetical protein
MSDGNGRFELGGLPPGHYSVWVQKPGYSVVSVSNESVSPFKPSRGVDLPPGRLVDRLTVAVVRGGVIAGQLTDETGEPLVDVTVQALRPSSSDRSLMPVSDSQTDDRGRYRIFGLQPGVYCVGAVAGHRWTNRSR